MLTYSIMREKIIFLYLSTYPSIIFMPIYLPSYPATIFISIYVPTYSSSI